MAKKPTTLPGKLFAALGSFWLAIALLVNLFLLTWLGTLEQVEKGIHAVQGEYFESWLVLAKAGPIKLLLPGGYVTMGLFVVNLFVGGLVRIRKTKATIGIIIAHVGIALMMAGGLVEHMYSSYGRVVLYEGDEADQFQEYAGWEVAIWNADAVGSIEEFLIPQSDFADLGGSASRTFQRAELPFDIILKRFMVNSELEEAVGVGIPSNPVVDGHFLVGKPKDKEEERNFAGVYATIVAEGGKKVEDSLLWGIARNPWVFEAGGKRWAMVLRNATHTMPFSLKLEKFIKDDHPGMAMARAYSSDVIRTDPDGTEHKLRIQMNEPLRKDGLIIYQASYGPADGKPGDPYTVLAVSRNPSDRIPWISVGVITLGLMWTFIARLLGFLAKQQRKAVGQAGKSGEKARGKSAA
ncbi:Cytochrome c biogenesis protein Ccs1 [Planctomycetes bacterium Poly30]|uniref:Cytochrome c biogenesis protein Ccs1 n=1 Tax=Saltatorellus ferox TaxID=2528018 RepID=A0A518ESR0_9BACT|nr:Cytochrome c biogenesis protein Ccs1 [Planctomycetes bacterium Poly30]